MKGIIVKTGDKIPYSGRWEAIHDSRNFESRAFDFREGGTAPTYNNKQVQWVFIGNKDKNGNVYVDVDPIKEQVQAYKAIEKEEKEESITQEELNQIRQRISEREDYLELSLRWDNFVKSGKPLNKLHEEIYKKINNYSIKYYGIPYKCL